MLLWWRKEAINKLQCLMEIYFYSPLRKHQRFDFIINLLFDQIFFYWKVLRVVITSTSLVTDKKKSKCQKISNHNWHNTCFWFFTFFLYIFAFGGLFGEKTTLRALQKKTSKYFGQIIQVYLAKIIFFLNNYKECKLIILKNKKV